MASFHVTYGETSFAMATSDTSDRAGVIAFPPLLFGSTFLLGLLLRWLFPTPLLHRPLNLLLGGTLLIIGLLVLRMAFREMTRAHTTIHPGGSTTAIVSTGIYAYTRNPMYLAVTVLYVGGCVVLNAWWGLLLLIPLLMVVQKGVIEREERYLTRKFGDEYVRYRARVRRWL